MERPDLIQLEVGRRSAFGLIRIYNLLPEHVVNTDTVKDFQHALTSILKDYAISGSRDWSLLFSPRLPIIGHPLLRL